MVWFGLVDEKRRQKKPPFIQTIPGGSGGAGVFDSQGGEGFEGWRKEGGFNGLGKGGGGKRGGSEGWGGGEGQEIRRKFILYCGVWIFTF